MSEMRYEPLRALSAIDRVLLRGASSGKSPKEISELTGGVIKPAAAAARVLEIIESRERWLTPAQRRMLLLEDLMALKDNLMERAIEMRDLDAAKVLRPVLADLAKVLAEDKIDVEKAMREITRAHANLVLAAISVALERSMLELERRYPQITKGELESVFHAAMPDAVKQLEASVPEGH